jgi:flagellar biosynthetic protein FliQ
VLLTGMVVGLIIGLLQGLTQIHEQSIAFVPKLVAMVLAIALIFPWALDRLIQYSQNLISGIPGAM